MSRTLKGQAMIFENQLIQEQIEVGNNGEMTTKTVVLINDIWADLTSASGTYKTGKTGYYYWEYQVTDIDDDSVEHTIFFECPKPKEDLFQEPYNPSNGQGDYAKYWLGVLKKTQENYEKTSTIQPKEYLLRGTNWFGQTGKVEIDDVKVTRDDYGDMTNLLNGLF